MSFYPWDPNMLVPFWPFPTTFSSNKTLYPRRGGGKGASSSKGTSKSAGSPNSVSPKSIPLPGKIPGGKTSATAYGSGGGKAITIPSGSLFAGRTAGGGERSQVFGSRWVKFHSPKSCLLTCLVQEHMVAVILGFTNMEFTTADSRSTTGP